MKRTELMFERPASLQATEPPEARGLARDEVRLLVSTANGHAHSTFTQLADFLEPGDLLVIHDTGAHGHAMGFNYNGRLRPQELLLCADGSIKRIRRAETVEDYLATLNFSADSMRL